FVECVAFGKQAEVIGQYCVKGKPLFVEGRLKYDAWEDKSGARRNKLSVVVENFQFIGGKGESAASNLGPDFSSEAEGHPHRGHGAAKGSAKTADLPFEAGRKFQDADIPF